MQERGGGLLFALGLNALLLLALLTLAPRPSLREDEGRFPVTFEMAPAPAPEQAKAKEKAKTKEKAKAEPEKREEREEKVVEPKVKEAAVKVPRPVVKLPVTPPAPVPFMMLDSAQMAAADIGKMPQKSADDGASGQGNSRMAAGPGEGPGGVQLFEAEWYRRPTPAELGTYIPANARGDGWGLVACKTVENFHVENCQALGESPQGSGFARAVRLAAWQFLVRPPRVNGKPMVGSWVRIRIDYSRKTVDGGAAGM
jgi:protein TonB